MERDRERLWHNVKKRGYGLKKTSVNFFFTNFPMEYEEKDIWKEF